MGAKQSKRSVDISGKEAEGAGEVVAAGGEGRVEALADADTLKPQLNGDTPHIQVPDEISEKEKQLENGTPENEKDATTEKETVVTNGSGGDEPESKPEQENGDAKSTPEAENNKKNKKEKVKKKWSLRSISFSRKEKPKQEKKPKDEEAKANGDDKLPEEGTEAVAVAENKSSDEVIAAPAAEENGKTPETPVTEPITNGSSAPETPKEEAPSKEESPAPSPAAEKPAEEVKIPEPEQLPVNGLTLEEVKEEVPESEAAPAPAPDTTVTSEDSVDANKKATEVEANLTPVQVTPVEVDPVEVAPIEMAPVEVAPVEIAPTEVKPVEIAPVEEKPVETAPVETKPVENVLFETITDEIVGEKVAIDLEETESPPINEEVHFNGNGPTSQDSPIRVEKEIIPQSPVEEKDNTNNVPEPASKEVEIVTEPKEISQIIPSAEIIQSNIVENGVHKEETSEESSLSELESPAPFIHETNDSDLPKKEIKMTPVINEIIPQETELTNGSLVETDTLVSAVTPPKPESLPVMLMHDESVPKCDSAPSSVSPVESLPSELLPPPVEETNEEVSESFPLPPSELCPSSEASGCASPEPPQEPMKSAEIISEITEKTNIGAVLEAPASNEKTEVTETGAGDGV